MRRHLRACGALAAVVAFMLLTAPPASAHERRKVGRYNFVVGWGDEPAYSGFKNSVQLILSDAAEKPVTDLGDTLKVEVTFGDQTKTLTIEPAFLVGVFGQPGDYRAWITPTRAGDYTFRFTGTIKGQKIDQRFACGEETFDCITDVSEIEFPADDPATGELKERLDREIPRLTASVADTDDQAGLATLLGIIGTALGALGLIALGIVGRRALRRS